MAKKSPSKTKQLTLSQDERYWLSAEINRLLTLTPVTSHVEHTPELFYLCMTLMAGSNSFNRQFKIEELTEMLAEYTRLTNSYSKLNAIPIEQLNDEFSLLYKVLTQATATQNATQSSGL